MKADQLNINLSGSVMDIKKEFGKPKNLLGVTFKK
jgi:hypothetical protein